MVSDKLNKQKKTKVRKNLQQKKNLLKYQD